MIRSHYVPQLILRHFGKDEKIQYCDLDKKTVETRNIRSTFAEKGYYPEEIESELCFKTEKEFAYLLNSKILKERYTISLTAEELFILKKYLIVTTIRYNFTEAYKEYGVTDKFIDSYSKDFYNNINKVLCCDNIDDLYDCIEMNADKLREMLVHPVESYGETKLLSDIRNIVHSYVVFVSTNRCNEEFVIPDVGFSYKATHIGIAPFSDGNFDKCMYILEMAMRSRNPILMQMLYKLTPYDYILVPVSKDLAIISLSAFYKFFSKKSDVYGMIPVSELKVSELIGFGDSDMVEPPKIKNPREPHRCYEYNIKQLSRQDIKAVNMTLINNAEHYFGYDDLSKIQSSIEMYKDIDNKEKHHNLDFL